MADKVYLVRHGLTESNKNRIYSGYSNESVCKEGLDSLYEVAENMRQHKIESIFTSPVRRAVQSAEIINSVLNLEIKIENCFKEMEMGAWEGLSEREIRKKYPKEWKIWNSTPQNLKMNGRESLHEIQMRSIKGIEKIVANMNYNIALVVTHVAVIRAIIIYFNNWKLDDYRKIEVPNGALFLMNNKESVQKIKRIY